jgi:hypothetical protein
VNKILTGSALQHVELTGELPAWFQQTAAQREAAEEDLRLKEQDEVIAKEYEIRLKAIEQRIAEDID